MKKLNLFENRLISLYLNAADKLKCLSKVSKGWNALIYSGFGWESLFSSQYDETWDDIWKVDSGQILVKFSHFRGVNQIFLHSNVINFRKLRQCQYDYNEICFNKRNITKLQVLQLAKQWQMLMKMQNIPFSISKIHLAAYWNFHQQILEVLSDKQDLKQRQYIDQDRKTPLHYAAENDSVQFAEILLSENHDVNVVDRFGQNALHYAASSGKLKMFKFLLKSEGDVNATNINQFNCLHIASSYNKVQIVLQILQCGKFSGIQRQNKDRMTPLHLSVSKGFTQIVQILLNNGANTQIRCNLQYTPICLAVQHNYYEITKLLINNQADLYCATIQNKTPLSIAVQNKNYRITQLLLQNMKYIPQCNTLIQQNPFHTIVQQQNLQFIDLFLKHVNERAFTQQNSRGKNVLAIAMRRGNIQIVRRLLTQNRSLLLHKNSNMETCLHYQTSNPRILQFLIQQQANIQACNRNFCTPLHFAIKNNNYQAVKILLKHCSNPTRYINAKNLEGWNAVHYAAIYNNVPILKDLLVHVYDVDINAKDKYGWIPLHYSRSCQVSEILINNRAQINSTDYQNWTPLHCASRNGNIDLVRLLIQKGARDDIRNYKQQRPIGLTRDQKIIDLFQSC